MSGIREMCRRMVDREGVTGIFYREVITATDTGRQSSTWEVYGTATVRVHDADAATIESYGSRQISVSHKLFMISILDVKEGDYIDIDGTTVRYQVRGFRDASSGTKSVYQIDAEKGVQD